MENAAKINAWSLQRPPPPPIEGNASTAASAWVMHQSVVVDVAQISRPRAVSFVQVVDVPEPHQPDPSNLKLSRLLVAERYTRPRMTVMMGG